MLSLTEHRVEVLVVHCAGRLTLGGGAAVFKQKLMEVLDRGEKNIVLDFQEITYIDSLGIGELAAVDAEAKTRGAQVKWANVSKPIRDLLTTVKLSGVFQIYGDLSQAVGSF